MAIVTGQDIGKRAIAALGLDGKRVQSIDLHIAADAVVTATVTIFLHDTEAGELLDIVEEYEMHQREK